MHRQFRPPNPSDGAIGVKATEGSGTHPGLVIGASEQTSRHRSCGHSMSTGGGRGGEPDSPSWCTTHVGLSDGLHQSRRKYPLSSRSSSGYISDGESLPSSPQTTRPVMEDRATQTPSPTGQVIMHARQRMTEDGHAGPRIRPGHDVSPELERLNSTREAQAATFGRELRVIGDDYNRLLILRRETRGIGFPRNPPVLQLHVRRQPAAMLCVTLLLLLIGRFMYLQNSTNSHDHSQV